MSQILLTALVLHIIFGLTAITAVYGVWMGLLRTAPRMRTLVALAWASAALFIVSWISGGYYYAVYYGAVVKPIIKEGARPWAHTVVMEAKEHVFLLIPILSILLALLLSFLREAVAADPSLRRAAAWTAGVITVLAVAVTLAGVLVSGAA